MSQNLSIFHRFYKIIKIYSQCDTIVLYQISAFFLENNKYLNTKGEYENYKL